MVSAAVDTAAIFHTSGGGTTTPIDLAFAASRAPAASAGATSTAIAHTAAAPEAAAACTAAFTATSARQAADTHHRLHDG